MAKRTMRLYIRISPEEYANISRNAERTGLSLSELARKRLVGEVVKERPQVELRGLYSEINHIGRNINQIAKAVNSGAISPDSIRQAKFLLSKIYDLLDERLV